MRITVWQYEENPLVSIDPLRFKTEAELVKTLRVQNCPDEELFDLQIPCVTESARHKEFITPKEEVQIN